MVSLRLKELRDSLKLSQKKMGDMLGIAQTTYANYESGKANIPDELKTKLINSVGLNVNWLLTGNGEMIVSAVSNPSSSNQLAIDSGEYKTPSGKTILIQKDSSTYSVPILASKVSAGPGCEWSQADFRELRMPTLEKFFLGYPKDDIFAAEVVGDSMQDIDLIDGDFVFAFHNRVRGNGIYVMALDTEVIVKRLEIDTVERKLRIISKNSDYPDKVVDPDRVIILGKVIGWLHRYAN